ncbi:homoserine dehydrogenase [Piscibacillus halophilus]|uniref:homoserine dehydrogenase n=1 Tax=Piscibacillus halophilus TaxID=571933 RepID=UPI00158C8F06|nr:homoserine dehydrogenase [Piscibacillus halophilus]
MSDESSIKVALLGFGTVGSGVYEVIESRQNQLRQLVGHPIEVVAVLVDDISKERKMGSHVFVTDDFQEILALPDLDVVVEAIVGVEPGYTYLSHAIDQGLHVVTANKELFAHKGFELQKRAKDQGVELKFEATVAGGVPIIGALTKLLQVNQVLKIEAILNGTSNYILTKMREEQISLEKALTEAQALGFAEANPTNDIEGYDALYKIMILTELLTGRKVNQNYVRCAGISTISTDDINQANLRHERIKHVGVIEISGEKVFSEVSLLTVSESHKLYSVEGVDNAVLVTGDLIGELVFQGPGAGKYPTASVMVEDLVDIYNPVSKSIKLVTEK